MHKSYGHPLPIKPWIMSLTFLFGSIYKNLRVRGGGAELLYIVGTGGSLPETRPYEISAGDFVVVVIAAVAVVFVVSRFASSSGPAVRHASLPTDQASYLGVYEHGALQNYQPIAEFAKAAGQQPNLVGYYSGWGEPFETSFAETVSRHGAITIVQWDPTLASVPKIAAGGYDSYLRSFADSVREFGRPVVIGFGHEMNAYWYSWGYGHLPASTFVAAWRHIVTLFRASGHQQCHLAVDTPGGRAGHRPDRFLVARREVCHLGRHRRLLLPSVRDLLQHLRQDHRRGADSYRPAGAAVRGRGWSRGGPGAEDPRPVRRDAPVRHARIGVVRHRPANGVYHQDWRIEDSPAAETAFRRSASALSWRVHDRHPGCSPRLTPLVPGCDTRRQLRLFIT